MEPTSVPAPPFSPGTGAGWAGPGLEGGESPAGGVEEGQPILPREVGTHLFCVSGCVCVCLCMCVCLFFKYLLTGFLPSQGFKF